VRLGPPEWRNEYWGERMRSHRGLRGTHGFYFRALLLSAISGAAHAQIGFDDVTFSAGIGVNATESFGASWGNSNADAYPDLNHGAEGLGGSAITDGAGTTESAVSADYDADGFVDVFVTNGLNLVPQRTGGQVQLFRNRGNGNHWLEFDLEGVASNRDGVGAKVYVAAGGIMQYREQNGGYHRWSQNYSRIHVALAGNTTADVTILWPSGLSDNYTGVAADAVYRAVEGQSIDVLINRAIPPII
jgi:ASPIC/UnbV protein